MANNWDIEKKFKPSNLLPFVLVFLLITSFYLWAYLADPDPVTREQDLEVSSGIFFSDNVELRRLATVSFSVENPVDGVYFVITTENAVYEGRTLNERQYDEYYAKHVNVTSYSMQVEETREWNVFLWSDNATGSISITFTYDDAPFAKTYIYDLVGFLVAIAFILNIIYNLKQLKLAKLWILAQRTGRELTGNEDLSTDFDAKRTLNEDEKQEKFDSVFGDN